MVSTQALRDRLVAELREQGWLHDDRVAEAFATVPRHTFVPEVPVEDIYRDRPFVTRREDGMPTSSSSQPAVMALMLEMLDVRRGDSVLEIGAGTGYNAALLAELAGKSGRVVTIDIQRDVAEEAGRHLQSAGYGSVVAIAGDGGLGHPPGAPYDRIIVTAGCWEIPPAWVEQLTEGGILVLPFRINGGGFGPCLALRKRSGALVCDDARSCGFMSLRGAFGANNLEFVTGDFRVAADPTVSEALRAAIPGLLQKGRQVDSEIDLPGGPDVETPAHYLALQGAPMLLLTSRADDGRPIARTIVVTSADSAVELPWWRPDPAAPITAFGTDEALNFLRDVVRQWLGAGRPVDRHLRAHVEPASGTRFDAQPRRNGDRYRFSRGAHDYEFWFDL